MTGLSPYSIIFGRECRIPLDMCYVSREKELYTQGGYVLQLRDRLEKAHMEVNKRLEIATCREEELYQARPQVRAFEKNDKVL